MKADTWIRLFYNTRIRQINMLPEWGGTFLGNCGIFLREYVASYDMRQSSSLQMMFTSCRSPHLPHRVERSFQRKNTNADTLNTRKITIKAIISTVKSASTMSSSSRVVNGDLKWQYTCKHMTIHLTQWITPFKSTKNIRSLKFLCILCILHTSNNWIRNRISKTI